MKRIAFLWIFFFLLANISSCSDSQIDINSASLEKLDELYGIGPAKAQAIIDSRPYEILDDLVNANGIGEKTLEKIKTQGLACIENSDSEEKEEEEKDSEKEFTSLSAPQNTELENKKEVEKIIKNISNEVIELNPKDIKIEDNSERLSEQDYALYGLIGFCVFLGGLYGIKFLQNKKYQQNEFR